MEISRAVTVSFPLHGEWTAMRTPAERVPSHGTDYFGQRYAFDFARLLGPYKKGYAKPIWHHLIGRVKVEDCYGWGAPVLAPFDGEVVAVGDGWPDRERLSLVWDLLRVSDDATGDDYRPLTGNYILLEGEPGVAMLAHLRLGSVKVQVGQLVSDREPLAEVGNSGNSTSPHLHFQMMDARDPLKAEGLPCKFRRYERFREGAWEEVFDSIPDTLEPIRVV